MTYEVISSSLMPQASSALPAAPLCPWSTLCLGCVSYVLQSPERRLLLPGLCVETRHSKLFRNPCFSVQATGCMGVRAESSFFMLRMVPGPSLS